MLNFENILIYSVAVIVVGFSIGCVSGFHAATLNKYQRGDVVEKYLNGLIVCMKDEDGIICVDNENPDKIPVTDLTKQNKGVE